MKIKLEQLKKQLQTQLKPIYVITGNESLLVDESCQYIKKYAKQQDYHECEFFQASAKFNWYEILAAKDSLSLFSDKKIIELHLPTGKPGKVGAETLTTYTNNIPENTLLIIHLPKLTAATQKSKWFTSLEKPGVVITIWPISDIQFPSWLARRLKRAKITTSQQGINVLASLTEGNLLAAKQSIEKLGLLYGEGELTSSQIEECLCDLSHFNIYVLLDSILMLDSMRSSRILKNLKATGTEPSLILWVLCKEIRTLAQLAKALESNNNLSSLWQKYGVWQQRQAYLKKHLQSFSYKEYLHLLQQAAICDQIIKGAKTGNIWQNLQQLVFSMVHHAHNENVHCA